MRRALLSCMLGVLGAAPSVAQPPEPSPAQRYQSLYESTGQASVLWLVAEAHLAAGDKAAAALALEELADQRLGFSPQERSAIGALAGDPLFGPIIARMRADAPRGADPDPAMTIDLAGVVPEGIAREPDTGRVFVSDMAGQRIVSVDADRRVAIFAEGLALRPLGMAVNSRANLLWVATTNAFWATDKPRAELLAFDTRTGQRVATTTSPDLRSMNDVALSPTGDVYVSDTNGAAVFRLAKGADRLVRLTTEGSLGNPNGLAVSGDGRSLYVARGLSLGRVDLADGAVHPVPAPKDLSLFGIDGLYWRDGALFAVQNIGMERLVRLQLDEAGQTIVGHDVLAAESEWMDIPTTAALAEDAIYLLANAQVDRLTASGKLEGELSPIHILRIPVARN
jgi:sugar lactone lactonase YvrE